MIGPLTVGLGVPFTSEYSCSRAGCDAPAQWVLHWRNPKIHAADRRKTWLACDDHERFLREFLAARNFPLEVQSVIEFQASQQARHD